VPGFPIAGDLQLTDDGTQLVFTSGLGKIAQSIRTRASIFLGSWRYDRSLGVPYFQEILVSGASVELVRRRFYDLIIGTDGVTGVTKLDVAFDQTSATVVVSFACVTTFGTLVDSLDFSAVA
jgi:hypothetical protein